MNSLKKVLSLLVIAASVNALSAKLPAGPELNAVNVAFRMPTALKSLHDFEKAVGEALDLSGRIKSEKGQDKWRSDVESLIGKTATFAALLEAQFDIARFLIEKSLEETYKDAADLVKEKSLLIKYINALVAADEAGEAAITPSEFLGQYLLSEDTINIDQVVEFCQECADVFKQVRESLDAKAEKRYELLKKKLNRR